MIRGEVNSYRELTISLNVRGGDIASAVTFVIDTGFSGYLVLPSEQIAALAMRYLGTEDYELGDGKMATFRVFHGSVEWNGQWRDVNVLESDGGMLVGMKMLYGHTLFADVSDGGAVDIETRGV